MEKNTVEISKRDNPKTYSQQNKFVYESNPFSDYFRAIPFLKIKNLLDRNKISLQGKNILIASCGCGIDAHYLGKFYSFSKICFADIEVRAMEK